ncbi:Replication protein A 70 kDa DNA-binding subunit C [Arachis hypogaea]|nr:Replication protein A 70 kDa DNA-binding subunit C [Arachis hypogaea]
MATLSISNSATHGVDRVADINPSKLEWSVVVGVVRLYEVPSQWNPDEAFSIEMILQDERGDRIHCSVPRNSIVIFRSVIREHEIYSMKNFIVQGYGKSVRTTPHKYKLSFYMKTSVSRLTPDTFVFNPFRFTKYEEIEAMASVVAQNHLIDCIGHVVAKEDARDLVTKTGQHTKRMVVYLEDLEFVFLILLLGHKMKCTLFGTFVDEVVTFLHRPDCEPLVMVAQLFKPYVYLNDVNIQSSFDPSRVYCNADFPAVISFKKSLLEQGDLASQRINLIESHGQPSVSDEISRGTIPIKSMEEVLNLDHETSCWVVGTIVSVDVGLKDWFYVSCNTCPRKVQPNKDRYWCDHCRKVGFNGALRYRLAVILTDGTGCIKVTLWNSEAKTIVGKSASEIRDPTDTYPGSSYPKAFDAIVERKYLFKLSVTYRNIRSVDQPYNVVKISDDESLIGLYSTESSTSVNIGARVHSFTTSLGGGSHKGDQSFSATLDGSCQLETESEANALGFISALKDSPTESKCESVHASPVKSVVGEVVDNAITVGICTPDGQGSSNKTFKRNTGKRKLE